MLSGVPAAFHGPFLLSWTPLLSLPFLPFGVAETLGASLAADYGRQRHRWTGAAFATAAGAGWFGLLAYLLPFYRPLGAPGALAVAGIGGPAPRPSKT